jgi:type IV pilus assembly protein PilP
MTRVVSGSRWWLAGCLLASLAACSPASNGELQQWVADQRSTARPKVEPIQAPKAFVPQAYSSAGAVSPFSSEKFTTALRQQAATSGNAALVAAEMRRRKEPLEMEPLDTMSMVGLLDKAGRKVALVRVGGMLHQVEVGQYLGQNYGRVMRISETEITLREIAQDAVGEWTERTATLQLQEGTSK